MIKLLLEVTGNSVGDLFHGMTMARRAMTNNWCGADAHRNSAYSYTITNHDAKSQEEKTSIKNSPQGDQADQAVKLDQPPRP